MLCITSVTIVKCTLAWHQELKYSHNSYYLSYKSSMKFHLYNSNITLQYETSINTLKLKNDGVK
jgi:hypothetical protein